MPVPDLRLRLEGLTASVTPATVRAVFDKIAAVPTDIAAAPATCNRGVWQAFPFGRCEVAFGSSRDCLKAVSMLAGNLFIDGVRVKVSCVRIRDDGADSDQDEVAIVERRAKERAEELARKKMSETERREKREREEAERKARRQQRDDEERRVGLLDAPPASERRPYDDCRDDRRPYDRYDDRRPYDRYDDRRPYDRYDDRRDDRRPYDRYDDRYDERRYDRRDDRRSPPRHARSPPRQAHRSEPITAALVPRRQSKSPSFSSSSSWSSTSSSSRSSSYSSSSSSGSSSSWSSATAQETPAAAP